MENTLGNASYQHTKVPQWTNNIVEQCLKRLSSLNKPFKYVGNISFWKRIFNIDSVTCIIMQKNGAGLHTATSCYWDTASDGI